MSISRTAQHVTLVRALESTARARPALFQDQFASALLPWSLRLVVQLSRVQVLRNLLERYVDARLPGVRAWVALRTRYIDERVHEALAAGIRQVVLMGAGYDCRAYRMQVLKDVAVFEVDRRDTQIDKRRRLTQAAVRVPQGLRYVVADFQTDQLATLLQSAGFDRSASSLFICEGVFVYLDAATVERMLQFVGSCAQNSRLVFTYGSRAAVRDEVTADGVKLRSFVRRIGEPWQFGIDRSELGAYLARFNLALEQDVDVAACQRLYLPEQAPTASAAVFSFSRLAVASVRSTRVQR
jgi:methyltransferase (TIGR00027 family)